MSQYNIQVTVSMDEADSRVEVDDLRKVIAAGLASMYGPASWSGDEPSITALHVDYIPYDLRAGEFSGMHGGLTADEIEHVANGRTIQAIKDVRTRLSLGLAEAKALVDQFKEENPGVARRPAW